MTTTIADFIRLNRLADLTDEFDGGTLEFWSGTRPASGATPAGVLQATATLPTPAGTTNHTTFLFTFGTIGDALRVAANTITWARYKTNGGTFVMDVSVGILGAPSTPPEEILMGSTSGSIGAFLHFVNGAIQG